MSVNYVQENCSHCTKVNLIYLGDLSDLTGFDVEAFQCWNCGTKQGVGDQEIGVPIEDWEACVMGLKEWRAEQ